MNRIFKSIFNRRTGTWQVVSEKASNTGTSGNSVSKPLLAMALGLAGIVPTADAACSPFQAGFSAACTGSIATMAATVSDVTVNSGEHLAVSSGNTLTTGSLTLNSGSNLDITFGAPTIATPMINVIGNITISSSTFNFFNGGDMSNGTYRLFNYTGTLSYGGANPGIFPADVVLGQITLSMDTIAKTGNLIINSPSLNNQYWDGTGLTGNGSVEGGSGVWNSVSTNWTNGTANLNKIWGGAFAIFRGTSGLVTIDGSQSVTGLEFLTDGYRLAGGVAGQLSLVDSISGSTAIRVHPNVVATLDVDLSGSGKLNKVNSGTLVLNGNNSYTGGTHLTEGILVVGSNTALGTGALSAAAGTTLDSNKSVNLGNAIILNGAVNIAGSNAMTLSGNISGNGALIKAGTAQLLLSGSNVYSGNTVINGGTLTVNGSLAGSTNVNSGGTLGGTGTVGNVTVASGGTLNPGNSIGTLTVNGNLTFASGSTYQVEADAAGNSDKVIVNGTATLNGNVVALPASGGSYQTNTAYTILSSTNALNGQFNSSVSSSLAFLNATLTQDTNNVYLHLKRNDISYSDVAQTPNQRSVANALQNAGSSGANSSDMNTVITAVNNLSTNNARAAFESISGAGLVNLRRASIGFTGNFGNQLMGRLQSSGMSSTAQSINGMQLAANDRLGDLMPALAQNTRSDVSGPGKFSLAGGIPMDAGKRGFWLRGFGFDQDTDSDGNAAGSRIKGVGITAGFDARVSNDLVVGAALSHATSDVRASFSETGKSRGNAAAVYASYASGPWNVNGNLMLAHNANNMNRNITVGAISRTANARFDSKTVAAYGEVSYDLPQATWTLQPLAGLGVTHNRNNGFTETGAGALNIQANAQNTTSTKTLFGARALFDLNGIQVQPRAMWAHEFGDLNKAMTAQLQGSPATSFATYGVDLPRNSFITGITVAGRTNDGLSLFADVQGEFNRKQTGVALLVGLRKSW